MMCRIISNITSSIISISNKNVIFLFTAVPCCGNYRYKSTSDSCNMFILYLKNIEYMFKYIFKEIR